MENGRYDPESADDILDAMMVDAKQYFGSDLNDTSTSIIRTFYRPIAERLAEAQEDIGLVLDSSQIDYAEGEALDLLTALIGIKREPATPATGEVEFSRDEAAATDYPIPSGTRVQTDSDDPVVFETTESTAIAEGTTSATAAVEALQDGVHGNVGANTIRVCPDWPSGVEEVTNPAETSGGSEEETDIELRRRAKTELAQGSRASAPSLINSVRRVAGVTSVSIFINDTNTDNTADGGLPDHSFELVVAGGDSSEIAQTIVDTKAAADTSYSGAYGTTVTGTGELPNGQTLDVEFSRPEEVKLYITADVTTTDEYDGNNAVKDSIIDYIGGILTSGNEVEGLGVGEDVIHGEIEYQIRDIDGVHDVTTLNVDTVDPPEGTSNIAISDSQVATADGTDDSITINTSAK